MKWILKIPEKSGSCGCQRITVPAVSFNVTFTHNLCKCVRISVERVLTLLRTFFGLTAPHLNVCTKIQFLK